MTQDQAGRLEGTFTALHMTGVNSEKHLLTLNATASGIAGNIGISTVKISEMRDVMLESFSQLFEINKNTKQLYGMKEDLAAIRKNTESL